MKLENAIAVRPNKTIYRDGDVVIKVFNQDFSKADVLNEALNQARAEETALHVPTLREVAMFEGKWGLVSDLIVGKTLGVLMTEHPEKQEAYMELFVDLQRMVHAQTSPLMTKLQDKMHRKISQTSLDATNRYELHHRLEGMPKHNKLCHGDFKPNNIILQEDGTAFILDWAHATQGNASADAARTFLLFSLEKDEETANRYLNLFCKKSDIAKQYVQKWIPIVAASQSVKGKPEERELLLRWANVMDYE